MPIFEERNFIFRTSNFAVLNLTRSANTVRNYPVPKSAEELKRFVAFANYYRRHIKNFAETALPLNKLTKKNIEFEWTKDCQESFESLKYALVNPPVLDFPNFSQENVFQLKTDASGISIGAVLSNSNNKPIAYASRALNKAELNYSTIEKELLAMVWAVKHFNPYLYGRKFHIFTDHKPLIYLFSMTNPSRRLTKFRLTLEEYDFTVDYIKGKFNVVADALSRITLKEIKNNLDDLKETVFVVTRSKSKKECELEDFTKQEQDPKVVELLKRPEEGIELIILNRARGQIKALTRVGRSCFTIKTQE